MDSLGISLDEKPVINENESIELKLDSKPFLKNSLINDYFYVQTLFDAVCLPYCAFSERIVQKHKLPRILTNFKLMHLAQDKGKHSYITHATFATININGHKEKLWGYIIKDLHYDLILGKGWAEKNYVTHIVDQHTLLIGQGTNKVKVHENDRLNSDSVKQKTKYIREGKLLSALAFSSFIKQAYDKERDFAIASVKISDINKALEKLSKTRFKPTLKMIRQKLPQELLGLENLFLEDSSNSVPPHRLGHDMEIVLEDDKIPPYGPLYEMSREELLVLRETLFDLFDKGWIRASSSPASSPVLFAKKPAGGLRFFVDYRSLNC